MSKLLKILIAPFPSVLYINACIELAMELKERGHHILFLTNISTKNHFNECCFELQFYSDPVKKRDDNQSKVWSDLHPQTLFDERTPLEKLPDFMTVIAKHLNHAQNIDSIMTECLNRYVPDIIISAFTITIPAIIESHIPWVLFMCANPLSFIDDCRTPPGWSGLGFSTLDSIKWYQFRNEAKKIADEKYSAINDWFVSKNLPETSGCTPVHHSNYLNLYCFPEQIDYTNVRPLDNRNWFRVDSIHYKSNIKHPPIEFPEQFIAKPGKLIYFTFGRYASKNINMITDLLRTMSMLSHRFILSLDSSQAMYEISDNMYAYHSSNQSRIIPLIDLVIFNGDSNLTKQFMYFGKPMIIMPFYLEEYDNAKRIEETGYGMQLNAYNCTAQQLNEAIVYLTENENLKAKVENTSKALQCSEGLVVAANLIEKLVN